MLNRFKQSPMLLCIVLAALTTLTALYSLSVGEMTTTPLQVISHLWATLQGTGSSSDSAAILLIRLPRMVLALLIGAALAQSGAVTQGIFRNPMADPSLLGISSGAAFAAALVIVLGPGFALFDSRSLPYLLPIACFCGGTVIAWIIARIASVDGYTSISTLLLAGLAISALVNAGIGLLSYLANDTALRSLTFWMFGSLGKAGWDEILIATPFILLPLLLIPRYAAELNVLLLGEAEAAHLGVDVERVKRRLMLLVILAVSTSVSVAGVIGFVGLIVPHLLRLSVGPDHRLLLPAAALLGGLLLMAADIVSRILIPPSEIPIGILTALIGGPFFLALLLRYRKGVQTL